MVHAPLRPSHASPHGRHQEATALTMLERSLETITLPEQRSGGWRAAAAARPASASSGPFCAELIDLEKRYGRQLSLQGLHLHLPEGSIYGLLGPNGAGKSTTLRIVATLLKPDRGSVRIAGIDACRHPRRVRALLGYVAQDCGLDKVLTGREHLTLHGDLHHLSDAEILQRSRALIEALGMGEWIDRRTGGYSGGMRRRLELACSLLHQPRLLVLDEPTVGLDQESRRAIWGLLHALRRQGTSVLLSSHDLEEVEALADQVGIIERGRLLAEGDPRALKASLGGDRLSLRLREFSTAEEAQQACQVLTGCPGVQQLVIDAAAGHSLHLVVEGAGVIDAVRWRLDQVGLPIFALTHSKPSLHDLYLQATGRNLADADRTAQAERNLKAERRQAMR